MNSNYGKPGSKSVNTFDFDLGIGSTGRKSLNDQKTHTSSYSSYSASSSSFSSTQSKPAWQPNKPSWTHQPAPTQPSRPGLTSAPTSMVGDILGKSWASTGPSAPGSGIGIVDKNPSLFGELLSSALGQGKSNSNVPLKNATPASNKNAYSMGNLNDSLPKMGNLAKSSGNWGSSENFGGYSSGYNSNSSNMNNNSKGTNFGGHSMKSMAGGAGIGGGMGSNKDPFVSLVDFGSKQSGSLNSSNKGIKVNTADDAFGDFQNASKSSINAFPSNASNANSNNFMGPNMGFDSNMSDFGIPTMNYVSQNQTPVQSSGGDPLDLLFSSSSASAGGVGGQQSSEVVDDWGLDSEFEGNDGGGGTTTELEGLPPPPAGVTASSSKNKGMDNYKQGQYADAIKWLSWAVILLEKAGDDAATMEVLTCRASCYKEVGEYKKAVADCSKMLEHDDANVSALVQRALLYESMEKYRLGAEDLRTVLKLDPGNRIARSTVHRLAKMAD